MVSCLTEQIRDDRILLSQAGPGRHALWIETPSIHGLESYDGRGASVPTLARTVARLRALACTPRCQSAQTCRPYVTMLSIRGGRDGRGAVDYATGGSSVAGMNGSLHSGMAVLQVVGYVITNVPEDPRSAGWEGVAEVSKPQTHPILTSAHLLVTAAGTEIRITCRESDSTRVRFRTEEPWPAGEARAVGSIDANLPRGFGS